jgi:hypothetical protein
MRYLVAAVPNCGFVCPHRSSTLNGNYIIPYCKAAEQIIEKTAPYADNKYPDFCPLKEAKKNG